MNLIDKYLLCDSNAVAFKYQRELVIYGETLIVMQSVMTDDPDNEIQLFQKLKANDEIICLMLDDFKTKRILGQFKILAINLYSMLDNCATGEVIFQKVAG